jgi:endo-1,4-beta-xylanase
MRHMFLTAVFAVFVITSCTPNPQVPTSIPKLRITFSPTNPPASPATITPVPTQRPQAVLESDAVLYSGPGNDGYTETAQLKAGTVVYPLGTYVDFVKVEEETDGSSHIGFIAKSAISHLPVRMPELPANEVPGQHLNIFKNSPKTGNSSQDDALTISNDTGNVLDVLGSPITLNLGLKISFALRVNYSTYASIRFTDKKDEPQVTSGALRRIDFATNNGQMQIDIRDGKSAASTKTIPLNMADSQVITITFADPHGKIFVIRDQSGQTIQTVDVTKLEGLDLPEGLFLSTTAYVGYKVSPGSTLRVGSLTVQQSPSGKWSDISSTANQLTLQQLGKEHGISIGSWIRFDLLSDDRYWEIMAADFDTAIPDLGIEGAWQDPGKYYFGYADSVIDALLLGGWRVRGSVAWGAPDFLPNWLKSKHYSREEYIQILKDYIQTVVSRYKGRVAEWIIANEAINRSFLPAGSDFWADKIGPEYIEMAFRWAREADPDAILIFNDYDNESPNNDFKIRTINKMFDTVKDLKSKGVPIDAIGMQMHLLTWFSNVPKKDDVIKTMRRFADLGVKIYITEFDVSLQNIKGSQQDRWNFEAKLYRDMVEACLESGVCKSFSTWGISDVTSWQTCMESWCLKRPEADPLMFDKELQPKPAYYAVRDALSQNPIATPKAP